MAPLAGMRLATALLVLGSLAQAYGALKPMNGSLATCTSTPDGFGSQCPKGEACCTTLGACVKAASCSELADICPPQPCAPVDSSFTDVDCPLEAVQMFKKAAGLKCQASSDLLCFGNSTAWHLECKPNGASSTTARLTVSRIACLTPMSQIVSQGRACIAWVKLVKGSLLMVPQSLQLAVIEARYGLHHQQSECTVIT